MAAGKLSPRQKMINMMYLVLTALLALNVSKEVLNSFFEVNLGIVSTTDGLKDKSNSTYNALENFNNEKKSAPYISLTDQIKPAAKDITLYIQEMKYDLVFTADGGEVYLGNYIDGAEDEDNNQFKRTVKFQDLPREDKSKKIAHLNAKSNRDASGKLFNPENKLEKGRATILREDINKFREFLLDILNQAESNNLVIPGSASALIEDINKTLEIREGNNQYGEKGNRRSWEFHNFHDMPAVSALTLLSKWQADIRNMEADVVGFIASSVGVEDLNFTSAEGTVIPSSNFVLKGEEFSAKIFLSAFDADQKPEIYIGDYTSDINDKGDTILVPSKSAKRMTDEQIINGKGLYKIRASRTGEQTLKGFIKIKQDPKDKYYRFTKDYLVSGKSFSVSPTQMNVLYRGGGTKNPISVSVAGYQAKDINISFSEGKKEKTGKGTWDLIVNESSRSKTVNVKVSVRGKKGTISYGTYEFRVKPLPFPTPNDDLSSERNKNNGVVSKSKVKDLSLSAKRIDFFFPIKTRVVSFRCLVQAGAAPKVFQCAGYRLSKAARNEISKLETGQTVSIDNIFVKDGKGKSYILPNAGFTYYID